MTTYKQRDKHPDFIPFGTRCLVERRETENETKGGIILAGEPVKMPEGMVVAIGDKCEIVKVGDYVLFIEFTGHELRSGGKDCLVVQEEDLMGRFMGIIAVEDPKPKK